MDSESQFKNIPKALESALRTQQAYEDYLRRLDRQVERGLMTPEERRDIVTIELFVQSRRKEAAQEEALTDALTGLPNRRAFVKDFNRLVKSGRDGGVLIADLDHFKLINDTYDHFVGDSVLV